MSATGSREHLQESNWVRQCTGAIEDDDAVAPLGGWRHHRQECESRIREAAGPEFERGYSEGRALTLDDAVSLALEPADP